MSSTPSNVVASTSTLSIVPSDSSPSGDDGQLTLEMVIQEILDDTEDVGDLKVDDVLKDKDFKDILTLAQKTLKDRQRAQQKAVQARAAAAEMERRKGNKEKATRLRATALKKAGFDQLSVEDVERANKLLTADAAPPSQAKPAVKVQEPQHPETWVPPAVTELQQKLIGGWPQFIFKLNPEVRMGRAAQGFRSWCVNYALREVVRFLNDKDLPDDILQILSNQKRDLTMFADISKRVISAWGLNCKNPDDWASRGEEGWVFQQLGDNYPQIFALSQMPKFESQAEKDKRIATETAKQQRREKLTAVLKERMLAVETQYVSAGVKEKLAFNFAKKYGDLPEIEALFGKDSNLSDESAKQLVKVIFTKAAALRMASAKEEDAFSVNVAKDYAKFAGITEQELGIAVSKLLKEKGK